MSDVMSYSLYDMSHVYNSYKSTLPYAAATLPNPLLLYFSSYFYILSPSPSLLYLLISIFCILLWHLFT